MALPIGRAEIFCFPLSPISQWLIYLEFLTTRSNVRFCFIDHYVRLYLAWINTTKIQPKWHIAQRTRKHQFYNIFKLKDLNNFGKSNHFDWTLFNGQPVLLHCVKQICLFSPTHLLGNFLCGDYDTLISCYFKYRPWVVVFPFFFSTRYRLYTIVSGSCFP